MLESISFAIIFGVSSLNFLGFGLLPWVRGQIEFYWPLLFGAAFYGSGYIFYWLSTVTPDGVITALGFAIASLIIYAKILPSWREQCKSSEHSKKMRNLKKVEEWLKQLDASTKSIPVSSINIESEWQAAMQNYKARNFWGTIERLLRVRKLEPESPYAAYWLGRIYQDFGFNWLAVKEFDLAFDKIADMSREDIRKHSGEIQQRLTEIKQQGIYPPSLKKLTIKGLAKQV